MMSAVNASLSDRLFGFLRGAVREIMQERIGAAGGEGGIVVEIERGIEQRVRVTALAPAMLHEMTQRIDAGGGHIGVGAQIEIGVEQGMRVEPRGDAGRREMRQRRE